MTSISYQHLRSDINTVTLVRGLWFLSLLLSFMRYFFSIYVYSNNNVIVFAHKRIIDTKISMLNGQTISLSLIDIFKMLAQTKHTLYDR